MRNHMLLGASLLAAMLCGPLAATRLSARTCDAKGQIPAGCCSAAQGCDCCQRPWWCPDDYCVKRMPCVRPPKYCGRCDDYCIKRMPCVRPPKYCGRCDDYCVKKMPCLKIPCCFPPYYKCPPPACCSSAKASCGPTGTRRPAGE
jgi:hypothetical protein